ncbi:sigma-70 family RNA polymerase sigma factor [Flavobacteriaceae bacterium]|uniref:sigma-70 family RNA polymerase sigma factor n=1 Tax=Candidatus Arcticimaribacter forsetii TaxID=2820661 RepID=UPI0020776EE2|nr:sigma-70 family RNA polymerase sigma factor [Candidatus Arcticimaribacter forsetii]MDB2325560.1 sigma-70 family RNA polymerase sigma factor [Flavobacteriaceae bacterium]MDB2345419.1 sigma-70 family RNA polymerase sigma factor [Flavobacteriaceae bacterium]MDB4674498.1 sigma-70 family RNA polymerase sigma factor [Flavobacteriaceae bacterium]MDB4717096.1 sigma-70 family RNA polymerase sigma factor [Flavobacteriaceae bacterium]
MSVSLTKEKDSVLVKAYIDGCERSLAVLIERHKLKIYNFINSKVADRDISEDIFQDTFIKVIKTLRKGSYHEEGKFLPWVMRISHNLIIDHFRKSNRIPIFESKDEFDIFQIIGDDAPNIESNMIDKQVVEDLKKLIVELPEDQREVLTMRLYKDMSFKEIAEVTGVSINTALGRMRYAVINIRKLIEEHQIVLSA